MFPLYVLSAWTETEIVASSEDMGGFIPALVRSRPCNCHWHDRCSPFVYSADVRE